MLSRVKVGVGKIFLGILRILVKMFTVKNLLLYINLMYIYVLIYIGIRGKYRFYFMTRNIFVSYIFIYRRKNFFLKLETQMDPDFYRAKCRIDHLMQRRKKPGSGPGFDSDSDYYAVLNTPP